MVSRRPAMLARRMGDALRLLVLEAFGRRGEPEPTRDDVDAAAAVIGTGLDHELGERPWIARPHEVHSSAAVAALLITDRRIAGVKRTGGDIHLTGSHAGFRVPGWATFSIPYDAVASLDAMVPLVGTEHRVRLTDGSNVRIPRSGAWSNLRSFLKELLELPPAARAAPREADAAAPDAWSSVVLHLEALRAREEIDPRTADDLVARAHHHRRSVRLGVGGSSEWFTTALNPDDLAYVLSRVLGAPLRVTSDPPSIELPLARPGPDLALWLANAAGLASLAVFGFGVIFSSAPVPTRVRVEVRNALPVCRYAFFGDRGIPLPALRPDIVAALNRAIRRAESELLVRRAALGWGLPASELMAVPALEVLARYHATTPDLRLEQLPGDPG